MFSDAQLAEACSIVKQRFSCELSRVTLRDISSDSASARDLARAAMYRSALPSSSSIASSFLSLTGDDTANGGARVEYIFTRDSEGALSLAPCECVVMYVDMSLSAGLEYCFADEEPYPVWHLTSLSLGAFESFRETKFELWEKELKSPSCEAAFRRMLQTGPVYRVFDSNMFPTPPHLADKYKVIDEKTGKTATVPHPVAQCRIWSPSLDDYESVNAQLQGAPKSEEEAKIYWAQFIMQLKAIHGEEYINELMR